MSEMENPAVDLDAARLQWMTAKEVCAELRISLRTFDRMRANGTGPRWKMVSGQVRVRRDWFIAWSEADDEATA